MTACLVSHQETIGATRLIGESIEAGDTAPGPLGPGSRALPGVGLRRLGWCWSYPEDALARVVLVVLGRVCWCGDGSGRGGTGQRVVVVVVESTVVVEETAGWVMEAGVPLDSTWSDSNYHLHSPRADTRELAVARRASRSPAGISSALSCSATPEEQFPLAVMAPLSLTSQPMTAGGRIFRCYVFAVIYFKAGFAEALRTLSAPYTARPCGHDQC